MTPTWAIRRRDLWLGLVALAGVLTFGVLRGVLVAVLISLLVLLHELDHPRVVASGPAPGLLILRPLERLADHAEELHRQGSALWAAAPSERPLQMLRRLPRADTAETSPGLTTGRRRRHCRRRTAL